MAQLYSWLGMSDLRLIDGEEGGDGNRGPLLQALLTNEYQRLILLSNSSASAVEKYLASLQAILRSRGINCDIVAESVSLNDPTDYGGIYYLVKDVLDRHYAGGADAHGGAGDGTAAELPVFHLSPGTPAMASVWMVISQSSHRARLIQSSREQGIREVGLPFFLQARERSSFTEVFEELMDSAPPRLPEFDRIIHSSQRMQRLIAKANRVARFDVSVLVNGESGTGKELLCRAIHAASPRGRGPFITVNCGAIPSELMESQFFGHTRGAFTGADRDLPGFFAQADGGTLFLDEIGELPVSMQVKLLRVLQEGEYRPLGSASTMKTDVRVLSATNRDLEREISAGNFREDLYYRLAVAVLRIPALRERREDLQLLTGALLSAVNDEFRLADNGWEDRSLSSGAIDWIGTSRWPGNVRQLINSLKQAALWSSSLIIDAEDIMETVQSEFAGSAMNHSDPNRGDLQAEIDELSRIRIQAALRRHEGRKGDAARELGFNNHQTLNNWMNRLGIGYTGEP